MKRLLTSIVFLFLALGAFATPARPGAFKYTQPDGSVIEITLHGDEWGHWATNAAGEVVRMDEDGFYRVVEGLDAEAAAQAASVRRAARRSMLEENRASTHVAVGRKHFLVILVAFKDKAFTTSDPQKTITSQLNDPGYSGNGATGSARDFYYASSNGYFEPIFDVYGPVTLKNNMSTYGGNDAYGSDKNPHGAVKEGCEMLDDQVNFADYDNDGDGQVDMVFMIYAGYGEADGGSANTIWPHQWNLSYGGINLTLDGKKVDKYACSNELAAQGSLANKLDGIGAVCHEFGHAMGLPDFYDTDYTTNGETRGLYEFSTMCEGTYNNDSRTPPYFNMEERILLGWAQESDIKTFSRNGEISLEALRPEEGKTEAYKILTDMDNEYFLLECRAKAGWDQALPGEGLIVYHVDKSSRRVSISGSGSVAASRLWSDWESYNAINENGSHPCFYIIPAASQRSTNYNGSSANLPFPGSRRVTSYAPKSWNNVATDISLSDITYSSGISTFRVSGIPYAGLDFNTIDNPGNGEYAAGSTFNLKLKESEVRPAQSVSWTFDGSSVSGSSVTLTAGKHVVEARISIIGGGTDIVTLEIVAK